jgi:hypothetical protein
MKTLFELLSAEGRHHGAALATCASQLPRLHAGHTNGVTTMLSVLKRMLMVVAFAAIVTVFGGFALIASGHQISP